MTDLRLCECGCGRTLRSQNRTGYHSQCRLRSPHFKARQKDRKLRAKYGIDTFDWEEMLDRAGHCCELCGTTEDLCVDHCHSTGQIRGVLCRKCNRSIGALGDTLDAIRKVVEYLVRYEKGEAVNGVDCPRCYNEGPHEKIESARDGSSRTLACSRCLLEWKICG